MHSSTITEAPLSLDARLASRFLFLDASIQIDSLFLFHFVTAPTETPKSLATFWVDSLYTLFLSLALKSLNCTSHTQTKGRSGSTIYCTTHISMVVSTDTTSSNGMAPVTYCNQKRLDG
jgi:hypothetical protein